MRKAGPKIISAVLLGLLSILTPAIGFGAADVIVRLSAKPDNPWLGQKVVLNLDVLAQDGWAQLKKVHDHEIGGGYVKRFETQGTRLQERIGGASYSGQRNEYLFFPQRAGELSIEPLAIDIEVKSWGAQASNEIVRQSTPRVTLQVRRPPGLEAAQAVIATPDFAATQQWQPQTTDLSAGDAVVRTVELQGADISAMVFPPLEREQLSGVGIYLAGPEVDDLYSRGDLTGKRTEKITYVMEEPGTHEAAELAFTWWNTRSEKLETATLPGMTFQVQAAALAAEASAPPPEAITETGHTSIFYVAGVVVLLGLLGLLLQATVKRRYRQRKRKIETSEKSFFREVARTARKGGNLELLNAALRWLDRIGGEGAVPRLDLFLSRYGDDDAVQILTEFCANLELTPDKARARNFYQVLTRARAKWLSARRSRLQAEQLLPPVGLE